MFSLVNINHIAVPKPGLTFHIFPSLMITSLLASCSSSVRGCAQWCLLSSTSFPHQPHRTEVTSYLQIPKSSTGCDLASVDSLYCYFRLFLKFRFI